MSPRPEFLDTNVLVYAFTTDPKAHRAEALLASGCVTGVQGLNEFANVARRKLGMDWNEVGAALASIRSLCDAIVPMDMAIHENGLRIADHYGVALFDALMIAAALRSGCRTFWSEDMHHGLTVDGHLRVANPFATA